MKKMMYLVLVINQIVMAIGDTDRLSTGTTVIKQSDHTRTDEQKALAEFILTAYTAKHIKESQTGQPIKKSAYYDH